MSKSEHDKVTEAAERARESIMKGGNSMAKTVKTEDKTLGLPKGGTIALQSVYAMQSKNRGTLGFGGKAVDSDGRAYQIQAWLIGSGTPVSK